MPDDYRLEVVSPLDPDHVLFTYATDEPSEGEALCQLVENDENPYTRCTRG